MIRRNKVRKEKRLWTEREGGPPLKCYSAPDEHGEGAFVSRTIHDLVSHAGRSYKDVAVLYRVNAQSRVIEQMLLSQGIPYRIFGGLKFFARKEIKDIVAYLRVLYNPNDSVSLRRIINTPDARHRRHQHQPARGAGGGTRHQSVSDGDAGEHSDLAARTKNAVQDFANLMARLQEASTQLGITELTRMVIEESGYERALKEEDSVQSRTRLENVEEMLSATLEFENEAEDEQGRSLRSFPGTGRAHHRSGCRQRRRGCRDADDAARRERVGISRRLHHRPGRRRLPHGARRS